MKILIIGPSWVGDAVISQSLLKIIIDRCESSTIDVLSPDWTLDIFKRMEEVSKSLIFPFKHGDIKLRERANFGKKLKVKSYDQVIVLPNSLKSALVPFFANIPKRTGWIGEMRYFLLNDIRKLNKKIYPRMVDRFVGLAFPKNHYSEKEIPFPHLIVDEKNLDKILKKYQLRKDIPLLTLCPGAEFGPSKRWPAANFSKIADHFLANKWQILLLGSKNDISTSKEVVMGMANKEKKSTYNLTGETSLLDAIDILSYSKLVLSNDSGLMHIASAVGVNLVALYGPSSPEFTPPLTNNAVILRKTKGYFKLREGSLPSGYHQSLVDIKPEEVIEVLESIE